MTTLVRWNPTRNIRKMQTDMDRLMESFFESPQVAQSTHSNLPLDVAETQDSYVISAAVPGLKSDDIDITVEDGVLTIAGEVKNSFETLGSANPADASDPENNEDVQESTAVKFHLRERRYGNFARKLRLPKDVDTEKISASQEDGILTISLGKSEAAQPKKISIS
ncbi:MAG: Hsp20/alpha crystallin family protein [Anaerolineae bacterium]